MTPKGRRVTVLFLVLTLLGLIVLISEAAKMGRDFYNILGIRRNASDKDIKKAFRKLSLKYHPDQNPSEEAKNKYLDINAAYETLSDPEKRKMFDQFGEITQSGQQQQQGGGNPFGFGGNPFGGGNPSGDAFSFFFGGGQQRRQQQQQRPQYPAKNLYDGDANVLELSEGSWPFYKTETDDDKAQIWLINFYHDQCGHCHNVASVYKDVAKETRGIAKVAAINCAKQAQLCEKQGIKEYPTLKLYGYFAHNAPVGYSGEQTKPKLVEYLHNAVPNFVKQETTLSFLEKLSVAPYRPQILIISPSKRKPLVSPTLLTLAKNFNSAFRFFAIPTATTTDDPEWSYLMQFLTTTTGTPININPKTLDKPQFFILTPTKTIYYQGPASFKELTTILTKYRTDFKSQGLYSTSFSDFVLQSRGIKLTPDLLLAMQNNPSAGYVNTIVSCGWLVKELTSYDGYNAEKPAESKFSPLLPSNAKVEAAKESGALLETMTPAQIAFQLFDSIQTNTKQVYFVDVSDTKMVDLLSQLAGNDDNLQAQFTQMRATCEAVVEGAQDKPLAVGTKNPLMAFGLNLKRHRITQITQDDASLMQYLISVDSFMELNESSPSGSRPFAKRVKVAMGLERDEL